MLERCSKKCVKGASCASPGQVGRILPGRADLIRSGAQAVLEERSSARAISVGPVCKFGEAKSRPVGAGRQISRKTRFEPLSINRLFYLGFKRQKILYSLCNLFSSHNKILSLCRGLVDVAKIGEPRKSVVSFYCLCIHYLFLSHVRYNNLLFSPPIFHPFISSFHPINNTGLNGW